jgi:hypothetical protein
MEDYYITNREKLLDELESRNIDSLEIDRKVDAFAMSEWGIDNFSILASDLLGQYPGFISRQVPTANIESVMVKIVADAMGLLLADMLYPDDSFTVKNDYKKSLVKSPIIIGHKKGMPLIERKAIAEYPTDGTLLSHVSLPGGESLIDFYRQQRSAVFGNDLPGEVLLGKFFQKCLQLATKKPDHVYEFNGSVAIKKVTEEADLMRSRPSAEWYYPIYFLLFIRRFLFESYDGSGDKKITETFRKSMDRIYKEIGIAPLVVRIPSGTKMLYVNPSLRSNDWKDRIRVPQDDNLFAVFNSVSEQLISLEEN